MNIEREMNEGPEREILMERAHLNMVFMSELMQRKAQHNDFDVRSVS